MPVTCRHAVLDSSRWARHCSTRRYLLVCFLLSSLKMKFYFAKILLALGEECQPQRHLNFSFLSARNQRETRTDLFVLKILRVGTDFPLILWREPITEVAFSWPGRKLLHLDITISIAPFLTRQVLGFFLLIIPPGPLFSDKARFRWRNLNTLEAPLHPLHTS